MDRPSDQMRVDSRLLPHFTCQLLCPNLAPMAVSISGGPEAGSDLIRMVKQEDHVAAMHRSPSQAVVYGVSLRPREFARSGHPL